MRLMSLGRFRTPGWWFATEEFDYKKQVTTAGTANTAKNLSFWIFFERTQ